MRLKELRNRIDKIAYVTNLSFTFGQDTGAKYPSIRLSVPVTDDKGEIVHNKNGKIKFRVFRDSLIPSLDLTEEQRNAIADNLMDGLVTLNPPLQVMNGADIDSLIFGGHVLANMNSMRMIGANFYINTYNPETHEFDRNVKVAENEPSGKGLLGNIYSQFRGNAKAAVAFLMERKEGVAEAALHHKDVGDIDIAWGDEKSGLKHIIDKHPEVTDNLQELLDAMNVASKSDNRIVLESDTNRMVVSKMKGDQPISQWLLSAYEIKEKSVSASSSDIETEPDGMRNGTAAPQNGSSSDKVSESPGNVQAPSEADYVGRFNRLAAEYADKSYEFDYGDHSFCNPKAAYVHSMLRYVRNEDSLTEEEQDNLEGFRFELGDATSEARLTEIAMYIKGLKTFNKSGWDKARRGIAADIAKSFDHQVERNNEFEREDAERKRLLQERGRAMFPVVTPEAVKAGVRRKLDMPTAANPFPDRHETDTALGKETGSQENVTDRGFRLTMTSHEGGYRLRAEKDGNFIEQAYYPDGTPMSDARFIMDAAPEDFGSFVRTDGNGQFYVDSNTLLQQLRASGDRTAPQEGQQPASSPDASVDAVSGEDAAPMRRRKDRDRFGALDESGKSLLTSEARFTGILDIDEEMAWLDQALPQLSRERKVEIVNGLIEVGKKGSRAYGRFAYGTLLISDEAVEGTTYHEAFHYVFETCMSDDERAAVLGEASKIYGTDETDALEELLAEDFRSYMLTGQFRWRSALRAAKPTMMQRIMEFFKRLYDMVTNREAVTSVVFRNIRSGEYANHREYTGRRSTLAKNWTKAFRQEHIDAALRYLESAQNRGVKFSLAGPTRHILYDPEHGFTFTEGLHVNGPATGTDANGNPVNAKGKLVYDKIVSIDSLTDADFESPERSVELPSLPENVSRAIGADGRPVIIKKNIFERNLERHGDLTPDDSREILRSVLYNPDLYGRNQPKRKPYNWVLVTLKNDTGENKLVLLEVNRSKENVEIVHWHYVDDYGIDKIKKQARSEGEQILILPSAKTEEAGALSVRTPDLSSGAKVQRKTKAVKQFTEFLGSTGNNFEYLDREIQEALIAKGTTAEGFNSAEKVIKERMLHCAGV